jgi:hypothetical protein
VKVPKRVVGVLLVALVVLYGIGSLVFVKAEADELSYERDSFDQVEIAGFDHVLRAVPSGSSLHADYYTWRFFTRQKLDQSERLGLPYYTSHLMEDDLEASGERGYIILPDNQFRCDGLVFGKGDEFDPESVQPYLPTEENIRKMTSRLSTEDKIYSNYGVDIYYFAD